MEYYKNNKYRTNWFNSVFGECEAGINLIKDIVLKEKLNIKFNAFEKEYKEIVKKDKKTNRELIKKAESLMKEINNCLENDL